MDTVLGVSPIRRINTFTNIVAILMEHLSVDNLVLAHAGGIGMGTQRVEYYEVMEISNLKGEIKPLTAVDVLEKPAAVRELLSYAADVYFDVKADLEKS